MPARPPACVLQTSKITTSLSSQPLHWYTSASISVVVPIIVVPVLGLAEVVVVVSVLLRISVIKIVRMRLHLRVEEGHGTTANTNWQTPKRRRRSPPVPLRGHSSTPPPLAHFSHDPAVPGGGDGMDCVRPRRWCARHTDRVRRQERTMTEEATDDEGTAI